MSERQTVEIKVGHISIDDIEINQFIDILQSYKEKYPGVLMLYPVGGYTGYDDYELIHVRSETEEEYKIRIIKEQEEEFKKELRSLKKYTTDFLDGKDVPEEYLKRIKKMIDNKLKL